MKLRRVAEAKLKPKRRSNMARIRIEMNVPAKRGMAVARIDDRERGIIQGSDGSDLLVLFPSFNVVKRVSPTSLYYYVEDRWIRDNDQL